MKKIQVMLIGLFGLMISGMASAQEVYPQLGPGGNTITMLNCDLLANDISLILSANVVGGVTCDTTNNVIGLSACHTAGLTTNRSVSVPPDEGTCPDNFALNDAGTSCLGTITGSGFPSATTIRGTVSSRYPGDDCLAINATGVSAAAVQDALDLLAGE